MEQVWNELYDAAVGTLRPRELSDMIEAGGVAAAVESDSGAVYTGVCVDTACSLGVCAERSAIFAMITAGEDTVRRVVAVDRDGVVIPPCGSCRELLMQLPHDDRHGIEILLDYKSGRIVTLNSLTPEWWLSSRVDKKERVPVVRDHGQGLTTGKGSPGRMP